MSRRRIILLALLVFALGLALFGDKTPHGVSGAEVVQPRSLSSAGVATAQRLVAARQAASPTAANRPMPLRIVARASLWDDPPARAPIRDLFAARSWNPPAAPAPAVAPEPLPAPTAPALPFVYQGKRFDGSVWEVFLGHGDRTLIVRDGSVIEGAYRVESVKPPVLALTYLPLAQSQTLSIGGVD